MPTIHVNGINIYYELHGSENAQVDVLNNGTVPLAAIRLSQAGTVRASTESILDGGTRR